MDLHTSSDHISSICTNLIHINGTAILAYVHTLVEYIRIFCNLETSAKTFGTDKWRHEKATNKNESEK